MVLHQFSLVNHLKRLYSYKQTLNYPKFLLPIKKKPVTDATNIYCQINKFKSNHIQSKGKFILEDGPPYANGNPHVGHALNKILKDIVRCQKYLSGFEVEYTPGWDCHGLPIELAASSDLKRQDTTVIRKNASKVAQKFIEKQMKTFKSWGVHGDWENRYATFDKKYLSQELIAFGKIAEKGLVFRDYLPIFWSPSSQTALAEAELEYNDNHISDAAFVKFELDSPISHVPDNKRTYLLIWTTTPWTLVSNEAIGISKDMRYVILNQSDEYMIAGEFCVDNLKEICGADMNIVGTLTGRDLIGASYKKPFNIFGQSNVKSVVDIDFVSSDKGTGLVHMAPNHGKEDFLALMNNSADVERNRVLVDENGCFTEETGPDLSGLSVLGEGNAKVLSTLGNHIFHHHKFQHSYPYDWRTKQPIIIRLSAQWFVDVKKLSEKAMSAFEQVQVYPPNMRSNMHTFISDQRPHWCISRQRKWGLPIPIVYATDQNQKPILDLDFIGQIVERVRQEGCDFWWSDGVEKIVSDKFLEKWQCSSHQNLSLSTDILDIWFDSGLSWWCRQHNPHNNTNMSDVYLEGVDQFRGWFSTSLLTGVAIRGESPYKSLVCHGFVVDSNGNKMSKSLGNVVDPSVMATKFGVDVLRLWACSSGLGLTCAIGDDQMKKLHSKYEQIRNMYRFMLGVLNHRLSPISAMIDLTQREESLRLVYQDLEPIDRYILQVVNIRFIQKIDQSYRNYKFDLIAATLEEITGPVSNLYLTSIKDRLYCDSPDSKRHKSALTTINLLVQTTLSLLAPVLPVLTNEILSSLPDNQSNNSDLLMWPADLVRDWWVDNDVYDVIEQFIGPIKDVIGRIPDLQGKARSNIGIEIICPDSDLCSQLTMLNNHGQDKVRFSSLAELFRCAWVSVRRDSDASSYSVLIHQPILQSSSSSSSDKTTNHITVTHRGVSVPIDVMSHSQLEQEGEVNECPRCKRLVYCHDISDSCCTRCSDVLVGQLKRVTENKSS